MADEEDEMEGYWHDAIVRSLHNALIENGFEFIDDDGNVSSFKTSVTQA